MGDKTGIGWTGLTWNIVGGCSRESDECINCYAEDEAARQIRMSAALGRVSKYAGLLRVINDDPRWNGIVRFYGYTDRKLFMLPMRKTKPRLVFVNSMSDLFHPSLSYRAIAAIFGLMHCAHWHTFQTLTKRPWRMRQWFRWVDAYATKLGSDPLSVCMAELYRVVDLPVVGLAEWAKVQHAARRRHGQPAHAWPLPNVWLGTSIGRAKFAERRATDLLACPAAVHWVSCEPLLDDVASALEPYVTGVHGKIESKTTPSGHIYIEGSTFYRSGPLIRWIVAGGESQSGARPCDEQWLRNLRDLCARAPAAFFLKQLGGHPDARAHDKALLDGTTYTAYPA